MTIFTIISNFILSPFKLTASICKKYISKAQESQISEEVVSASSSLHIEQRNRNEVSNINYRFDRIDVSLNTLHSELSTQREAKSQHKAHQQSSQNKESQVKIEELHRRIDQLEKEVLCQAHKYAQLQLTYHNRTEEHRNLMVEFDNVKAKNGFLESLEDHKNNTIESLQNEIRELKSTPFKKLKSLTETTSGEKKDDIRELDKLTDNIKSNLPQKTSTETLIHHFCALYLQDSSFNKELLKYADEVTMLSVKIHSTMKILSDHIDRKNILELKHQDITHQQEALAYNKPKVSAVDDEILPLETTISRNAQMKLLDMQAKELEYDIQHNIKKLRQAQTSFNDAMAKFSFLSKDFKIKLQEDTQEKATFYGMIEYDIKTLDLSKQSFHIIFPDKKEAMSHNQIYRDKVVSVKTKSALQKSFSSSTVSRTSHSSKLSSANSTKDMTSYRLCRSVSDNAGASQYASLMPSIPRTDNYPMAVNMIRASVAPASMRGIISQSSLPRDGDAAKSSKFDKTTLANSAEYNVTEILVNPNNAEWSKLDTTTLANSAEPNEMENAMPPKQISESAMTQRTYSFPPNPCFPF